MSLGGERLPAPAGLLIDRSRPIGFRFEGRPYRGFAGDTIASALAANGVRILSRSFKYHRPRGILTMAGQDSNTLVQVGAEPNVPADRRPIAEGLVATGQNTVGSLERDRGAWIGALGRFLPVGFYYRAFYGPGRIFERLWEPVIRRAAGLGRVDPDTPGGEYDKAYAFADVAVVGGGPAGLAAALAAAEAGAEVVLIEENPVLGGALTYARFDTEAEIAEKIRAELVARVDAAPRITVMTEALCNGWFADNYLPVIRGNRLYKLRAREVVLATGTIEQPALFRNNDLPGVMLGSAAQRLVRLYGVRPGRCAVVLAANAHGYQVALDMADAGLEIAAVVDLRDEAPDDPLRRAVAERGLRVLEGWTVTEALAARSGVEIAAVEVHRLAGPGAVAGEGLRIPCDTLLTSVGYTPTYQLALQAGARLDYDDEAALFSISGLPEHLALAGSVNGMHDLEAVIADGRRAGWLAARATGFQGGAEPPGPGESGAAGLNHPWPVYAHPKGKVFVDFDEDLQLDDIVNSAAEGYAELELVKRFSTVGMGPSQGRLSALATARLLARSTGRSVAEVGVTTARPPFAGEKLGVLAGRKYEPERLTPMHHRHLELGAQMMTAGSWWRPAFYGPAHRRGAIVAEEAKAVRDNLGAIDVSTLGGLEIRGPDAAEFMERLYTFAYRKQPVGRARYALMTDQTGTIVDDGVACRLREDHYYVTATTGGVERVFRSMLWWNAQWRLEVDVANVTAAYAAVNVAGPRARDLLAGLVEGIDLLAPAFPYMGVREGRCAGIPARFLRVGFVGELGWEIHVPASCGEALWDAILDTGRAFDLRPFGVEAQRLLRLEKGHIIVGQDTDAMTFPQEVDMAWAIAGRKPFFVGGRSIELRARRPLGRKLVGFALDEEEGGMPRESDLVLRDGRIAGFVTSVVRSPSLGRVIGLAYAHPADAEPGRHITIWLDGGVERNAEVVPLPFYDPDNRRQEL